MGSKDRPFSSSGGYGEGGKGVKVHTGGYSDLE